MPTVLIIEDDYDLLFLYRTALTQKGFTVKEAHNSTEAMDQLQKQDFVPEMILMDIGMPDIPGTRVIDYVRGESRFDATRIVVVTANEQYRERVTNKNISRFLVKPISIAQLAALADELIG
jgi:two-component system, OmpR family, KDP operon response regulator KdpE